MKRISHFKPRPDMLDQLFRVGFDYYDQPAYDGSHYWTDQIAYEFQLDEIEQIEAAAHELHQMSLAFVADEIQQGDYCHYAFSNQQKTLIENAWKAQAPTLYERIDLTYHDNALKLSAYRADAATSLLESAIVQAQWLTQIEGIKNRDQFNWIHQALLDHFQALKQQSGKKTFHFAGMANARREEQANLDYLCDVAELAGWAIHRLNVEDIRYQPQTAQFVDLNHKPIEQLFKHCPLETFTSGDVSRYLPDHPIQLFEPAWKLLLNHHALPAKLWQKYPHHPLLLPHTISGKPQPQSKKGFSPVLGIWVVGHTVCGMGIRETPLATDRGARFIPHYFVE